MSSHHQLEALSRCFSDEGPVAGGVQQGVYHDLESVLLWWWRYTGTIIVFVVALSEPVALHVLVRLLVAWSTLVLGVGLLFSWRAVGCGLLHVLHFILFTHPLETWPGWRHPKHSPRDLMKFFLSSSDCFLKSKQSSKLCLWEHKGQESADVMGCVVLWPCDANTDVKKLLEFLNVFFVTLQVRLSPLGDSLALSSLSVVGENTGSVASVASSFTNSTIWWKVASLSSDFKTLLAWRHHRTPE